MNIRDGSSRILFMTFWSTETFPWIGRETAHPELNERCVEVSEILIQPYKAETVEFLPEINAGFITSNLRLRELLPSGVIFPHEIK